MFEKGDVQWLVCRGHLFFANSIDKKEAQTMVIQERGEEEGKQHRSPKFVAWMGRHANVKDRATHVRWGRDVWSGVGLRRAWEGCVEGGGGRRAIDLYLKRHGYAALGSTCSSHTSKQGRGRWRKGRLGWGWGTWPEDVGGEW